MVDEKKNTTNHFKHFIILRRIINKSKTNKGTDG